jgi:hypothetical protein
MSIARLNWKPSPGIATLVAEKNNAERAAPTNLLRFQEHTTLSCAEITTFDDEVLLHFTGGL